MPVHQPSNIYREQLSSLNHGLALLNPKPVEDLYSHISIGDVGYLLEDGSFMRLFNVTLPWNDPSNRLLEVPEEYKRLELGHSINVRASEMREREHCSHLSRVDNIHANTHSEGMGQMYECQPQTHGALLSVPHGGHTKDVFRIKVFKDYIKDNVDSWFRWSKRSGFLVEHMEDLILVTGCTLVTSWAVAVFDNSKMSTSASESAAISLDIEESNRGGAQFSWRNRRGNVYYDNSYFDTTVEGPLHRDQCVFIRGFRARRILFRTKLMRAEAEPLPDDPDNRKDDEIQVSRIPDGSKYRDPLVVILDYIEEKCQEDIMAKDIGDIIAIVHDDDLQLFEGVETTTANAIEKFLREKKLPLLIENGTAILRDPADAGGAGAGYGHGDPPSRGGRGGDTPLIYTAARGRRSQLDLSLVSPNEVIVRIRKSNPGPERPARPGYGTAGRAVALRANFFALESMPDMIYEYIVQITPEPRLQRSRVKRRVLSLFEQKSELRHYINDIVVAHDGTQRLISSKPLPDQITDTVLFDSQVPSNAEKYDVEITFFKELSTEPLKQFLNGDVANINKVEDVDPVIAALNLVMQRQAAQQGWRFGRHRYFFNDDNKQRIGPRVWALMGFYSSARPGNKLPFVNINICMSAFYEPGKLSDALRAFLMGPFDAIPREFMRNVKVSTRYLGYKRVMTINRVVGSSASRLTFNCERFGGRISIKDYFFREYNISLKHADDLPIIDVGNSGRSIYIPAELCDIEPGEPHLGKLGPKETLNMLKVASRKPAENTAIITENGLPRLGYNPSTSVLQSFNIRLASQMAVTPGRELPQPSVTYGKGVPRVQNGSWNILEVKFHHGAKMTNWKVLVVRDGVDAYNFSGPRDERLISFIKALANKCRNSGMEIGNEPPHILPTDQLPPLKNDPGRRKALDNIAKTIERFGDPKNISFILCLLQRRDDFIYPGIKRLCAVNYGVRSQCLLLEMALNQAKQDQYLSNVALKVNTKLGGINHKLGGDALGWLMKEPTILVGIDVTHPGPSSVPGTPSIAGVVASVDKDFVQFPASLRLQKSKQEGIAELSDMIIERLQAFRRRSKVLPKRMIIFRHGVSEGRYVRVINEELPQIFEAFKRIDAKNPKYRPTLSIVICNKRHNARFYPTNSEFADRNGNTRPGTVVDKGVTSMLDFDFYLQAHAGIRGTVKPTHYAMIYDESSLTADMVQQGVHALSYLYARATKAVSLVPPAYYASIVCEQARFWIHGFLNLSSLSDTASSVGGPAGGLGKSSAFKKAPETADQHVFNAAQKMWGNGLHPNLQDSMFYI